MSRWQPGPDDVAALRLSDDEGEVETRREAVEACLGALQRNEGQGTLSVASLRNIAFDVDGGETADSPQDAWETYVRSALSALDTVDTVSGTGRWRYVGPSERVADPDRLAEPDPGAGTNTEQVLNPEDDPLLAGLDSDERAALADAADDDREEARRRELTKAALVADATDLPLDEVIQRRAADRDADAPAPSSADREHPTADRNADAAAALKNIKPDRGPTPTPTPTAHLSDADPGEDEQMDPATVEERVLRGDAGSQAQARARRRARNESEVDRNADAALGADAGSEAAPDAVTCARCEDATAEVDAPPMNARFEPDARLCQSCFATIALGTQRADAPDK